MSVISERMIGAMPVSIATAIAMQKLAGMKENEDGSWVHTNNRPSRAYNQLWINLRTLVRNLVGSIPTADRGRIDEREASDAILSELAVIVDGLELWDMKLQLEVYYPGYRGLEFDFPGAELREPSTEIQRAQQRIETKILDQVLSSSKDITQYRRRINNALFTKAVILTHHPVDLLAQRYFDTLHLLESHTGTIKGKSDWWTKFVGSKDFSMIPFNDLTLPIMGDGQDFKPASIRARTQIHELAKERRWSAITNEARIRSDLRSIKIAAVSDELAKYL